MKITNYHLFDFLDFDPDLSRNESLWKSYKPLSVEEKDGDIHIIVPYQKQVLHNDMQADDAVPQESSLVVLRQYGDRIIRIYTNFTSSASDLSDESDMLQLNPELRHNPLTLHTLSDNSGWEVFTADGTRRALINTKDPEIEYWSDLQPAPQPSLEVTLWPDGKREIRLASQDHFSPPRYDALPLAYCKLDGERERATLSFECKADECFAGTGERFMKMDLSGQTFFLKNQDGQGVNNRRTYKNIPFYLSSRMYACFYHTTSYCKLSLAGHSTRSVQLLSYQPLIDAFLIGGDTVEEILRGYRDLTGYPSMPPLWSFGVWMSRMTYFSADEVNAICDRLRNEHYPCDVIHLDTGWFKTDWLCEWKFNDERFPDPPAFLKRLRDNGYRVSLWQLPYISSDAEQADEAREKGYMGKSDRRNVQREGSNFSDLDYEGTIDFTNPEAVKWYQGLLKNLLDMGVVCIKTDFGENIHMDAKYHGMKPELLNNVYALLYQRAAYEITEQTTGQGIQWARSAWAGCQRYPLHWGGDSCSSWDGLAGSLRGGIHFGLSGFAFWSHDVPGFHTLPNFMNGIIDDKVYMRWTQFGVFSSHIRYHGSHEREPWHYPAIAPMVKRWWNLRYSLIPYIIKESERATHTGESIIQALICHHPDDRTCWHIDDEYYFGNDILVAPVMNSDDTRDLYLPEGSWINLFTGETAEGGRWLHLRNIPLDEMPAYVRPGTVLPVYPHLVECTDQMDLSQTTAITVEPGFPGIMKTLGI